MSATLAIRRLSGAFAILALILLFFVAPAGFLFAAYRDQIPSQWDPFKPLDLKAPSTFVKRWKISRAMGDGALCLQAIASAGLAAKARDDWIASENCGVVDAVSLRGLESMSLRAVETRCGVALSLYLWEREAVQPAAQRIFGEGVDRLLHLGSYSCRRISGRLTWSQHAQGNAVDVTGFRLKSGRVVSVRRHWRQDSDAARFLRHVRDGACDHFTMVLSPDYNAAHQDHFHFDLGFWRGCR